MPLLTLAAQDHADCLKVLLRLVSTLDPADREEIVNGSDTQEPLYFALLADSLECTTLLLRAGAALCTELGNCMLIACRSVACAKLLLAAGGCPGQYSST